jgi:hypothetical protein
MMMMTPATNKVSLLMKDQLFLVMTEPAVVLALVKDESIIVLVKDKGVVVLVRVVVA